VDKNSPAHHICTHSTICSPILALALIGLTALDLFVAHGHFNPASDPALSPRTANRGHAAGGDVSSRNARRN
jgi:hypothetical protein